MKRENYRVPVWFAYTLAFILIILLTFGALHTMGRSTIWSLDGIAQHYPILKEFYQILHGTAHQSLFSWSWNLGLGADQMTTFAYYVVGDPFSYLIALFPANQLELGYTLLTLLRLYVVGLAFIALAKQFHFRRAGTLIGALIYTFNGFTFYVSYHHPFFLLPMILFPLLCLTIDRILHGHSWIWLALVTAIVLICNVYFAYLLAIGAALFLFIRYFDLRIKHTQLPKLWQLCLRFGLAIVLALLVAAVILLPTALAMISSSRVGGATFANGLTWYPEIYYRTLPDNLLTSNGTIYYWATIATSGIVLIAMVWSMRRFRQYLAINVTLILIAVGLLIPAVSATLNVMSTPSNRWLLMAQLVFGLLAATLIDHLNLFDQRDFWWLTGVTVIFIILIWIANGFIFKFRDIQTLLYVIFFMFVWLMSLILLNPHHVLQFKLGMLGVVMLNTIAIGLSFYSSNYSGAPANELPTKTAAKWSVDYFDRADQYLNRIDHSFYRTATSNNYYSMLTVGNDIPMLLNTHTISSYYSVQNGDVNTFNQQLANSQNSMNNPTSDVDTRTSLLSLLNVKYLFARQDDVANHQAMPYGFNQLKTAKGHAAILKDRPVFGVGNGTGTAILKNKYALPLAYTQSSQITPKTFNSLSAIQKQQSLLQGAAVTHKIDGLKQATLTSTTHQAAYSVKLTSEPVLTIPDAINYRLTHNIKKSMSASVKTNLKPSEAMKYAAATGLETPSATVQKLLADNQATIDNNTEANQHGLKAMTSDVLGTPQTYQLKLKHPSRYQKTELYVDLSGITTTFSTTSDRLTQLSQQSKLAGTPLSRGEKTANWRSVTNSPLFDAYTLNVSTSGGKTIFNQLGINNLSDYEPKHHLLINLGYSDKVRKTINLSFIGANQIHFKHVKVVAVPYGKAYRQQTKQLQSTGLTHQHVTNNTVEGTSTATTRRILTTSIPYSTGWQLSVDGKKQATQVVNSGFVGAILPKGQHQITLRYQTPGLRLGLWLSILGVSLSLVLTAGEIAKWYLTRVQDRR